MPRTFRKLDFYNGDAKKKKELKMQKILQEEYVSAGNSAEKLGTLSSFVGLRTLFCNLLFVGEVDK